MFKLNCSQCGLTTKVEVASKYPMNIITIWCTCGNRIKVPNEHVKVMPTDADLKESA